MLAPDNDAVIHLPFSAVTRMANRSKHVHLIARMTFASVMLCYTFGCATTASPIPELQKIADTTQLHVDGKPFLILGGELGNSTASDLPALDAAFAKCQRMHLNTVMLPVYWDRLEPEEGRFDFTLLQGALDRARAHHLHLVYLWFGTWKNSMSCYAPSWVKRDTARFERVRQRSGDVEEIIAPTSTSANDADARAFATLMRWTKTHDAAIHTVLMVQVENEIGMIPDPRDYSEKSNLAFRSPVPPTLLALATHEQLSPEVNTLWQNAGHKTQGTWTDVFGASLATDELFSAWQFATYVQQVAAAGKREYPLPMYANAALIRPGYQPGQYPSAGPLPHLLEVWRAAAPTLDFISPDIYFPNFMEWAERYTRNGNPLFIPETAPSARAPANALYAIAQLHALGASPFAIEELDPAKEQQLAACYALLQNLAPAILHAQENNALVGLAPPIAFDWSTPDAPQHATLGEIRFEAQFDRPQVAPAANAQSTTLPTLGTGRWEAPPATPRGAVLILQLAPDEFLIAGAGTTITFAPAAGSGKIGIDQVQEGHFAQDGAWITTRWLNGDQTHQGRHIRLEEWSVQRVKLYRY